MDNFYRPAPGFPEGKLIASYPWYIEDWRGSQARINLNLEERALYRELLDFCYIERSLPTNERALARIANCSDDEFGRAWPNVQLLFNRRNDRYHHEKVDQVLAKLDGYREQKSIAGRASGERRRNGKRTQTPTKHPTETPTEREPSSSSSSIDDKKEALRAAGELRTKPASLRNSTTTDKTSKPSYASPKDELIAFMEESTGVRPDVKLLRQICEAIEINGATVEEYLQDIRPRVPRLKGPPGPGFFRSHAQRWGKPENGPAPEPKIEQPKNGHGRCLLCSGVGQTVKGFCSCAMGVDLAVIAARPQKEAS